MEELKQKLRTAIANYMASEGCSCCQDGKLHPKHEREIAILLEVPLYEDGSGFDFQKYSTAYKK